jgi:hypothetical protein
MAQVSHFRFPLFLKTVLKNLAMNNLFLRTKNKKKDTTTVSAQNILKCGFAERFQSQNLVPKTKNSESRGLKWKWNKWRDGRMPSSSS